MSAPTTAKTAARISAELDKLTAELRSIRERVENVTPSTPPDIDRDAIRERLHALNDSQLVTTLLATHKLAEQWAGGKLRQLLAGEAVMLTTTLDRFAPVSFGDGLAAYFEHQEDESEDA